MIRAARRLLAALVCVLAAAAMLATLLTHYANHVLVSPSGFSDRAASVLDAGGVQSLIVQTVTARLDAVAGDQTSLRAEIQDAVQQVVSSAEVETEVRAAAATLHGELVSGTADQLTLTLPDIGSAIASSVESESPQLAAEVRNIGTITVLDVQIPPSDAKDVHDAVTAGKDATELLIGTVVLILLALTISPGRRGTLVGLGLGAVISGLVAVAIYLGGRGVVVNEFSSDDARTAAHAVWNAYLSGLEIWGFVLSGVGAVTAVAATWFG
jgi:hypothetical protein